MLATQRPLSSLTFRSKLPKSCLIFTYVFVVLLLDQLVETVHQSLIEVLFSQVGVSAGSKNLKNTTINGQDVPPPLSPPFLSKPQAIVAAVGSLIIRGTSSPAMMHASFVVWT